MKSNNEVDCMGKEVINYDVVSEIAGHQPNKDVPLVEAATDIFAKVKEKAMECSVNGEFISFQTIDELQNKLKEAAGSGFSIKIFDAVIGG